MSEKEALKLTPEVKRYWEAYLRVRGYEEFFVQYLLKELEKTVLEYQRSYVYKCKQCPKIICSPYFSQFVVNMVRHLIKHERKIYQIMKAGEKAK